MLSPPQIQQILIQLTLHNNTNSHTVCNLAKAKCAVCRTLVAKLHYFLFISHVTLIHLSTKVHYTVTHSCTVSYTNAQFCHLENSQKWWQRSSSAPISQSVSRNTLETRMRYTHIKGSHTAGRNYDVKHQMVC